METPNVMHCTWVEPGEGVAESWTESHGVVFLREPPGGEKQGKGADTGDMVRW